MNNRFANKLAKERDAHGLSAEALAGQLGVSADEYAAWERGEVMPPVDKAAELASILGTTVDEMLGSNYMPQMRMGAMDVETPSEKKREWAEYEAEIDRRCERGRKIMKAILIAEVIFLILSFFGRSLVASILNIVILVFLWRGKSWARYVYVGLSAFGIILDLLTTAQLTEIPILFVLSLVIIAYRVTACALLLANSSVEEFLSEQNTIY